jgi:hypothetical protein
MRLRQLATTQSVCFFAFPATHQSILDTCGMKEKEQVNSSHVVRWLLEQTCRKNEQLQNLYISQGRDFCNRINAEWANAHFLSDSQDRSAYITVLEHPEQQTLEQLYGDCSEDNPTMFSPKDPQLQILMKKLDQLRLNSSNLANSIESSALEEVEQEREVEFEVEEVREVQKSLKYEACRFPGLHPAISEFVSTGRLCGDEGYEYVFKAISHTHIGKMFGITVSKSCLFVSREFMKTIETETRGLNDNFLVSSPSFIFD